MRRPVKGSPAERAELGAIGVAALEQIAASPLCDPMTAAVIRTLLRGQAGEELRDLANARGAEFLRTIREQRGDQDTGMITSTAERLRVSALSIAMFAVRDTLAGRHGHATRTASVAAKRLERASRQSARGPA